MSLYVVSDRLGYVATYPSAAEAEAAMQKYRTLPFIVQQFALDPAADATQVWVVPLRDSPMVAFVSNNREAAVKYQATINRVGFSFDDDIDYWQQSVGVIAPPTEARLSAAHRANLAYGAEESTEDLVAADLARVAELAGENTEGPIQRYLRENAKVDILQFVTTGAEPADTTVATEPADTTVATEPAAAEPTATEQ